MVKLSVACKACGDVILSMDVRDTQVIYLLEYGLWNHTCRALETNTRRRDIMEKITSTLTTTDIGRICHEANTALCVALGDPALPHWEELDHTYRASTIQGVVAVLHGATHEELHNSWMAERTRQGWVYGPVLDRENKIHPNLKPYAELPEKQCLKDQLFSAIVKAVS